MATSHPTSELAIASVRDALAGVRAVALLLTGSRREEVDQTALLLMIAKTCECADHALEVIETKGGDS